MPKATEAQIRAAGKYKKEKCKSVCLSFYPTDMVLYDHLCNCGEPKMTYIKRLIREDIERKGLA